MARRATILDEIWNTGDPVLMIDAGDLFGRRKRIEREQTRFVCELTSEFGYDAIGLGEADLNYGLDFLREMMDTYQLPFTSANVRLPETGELILPEYLLIERGGVTFGVCSVLDPASNIMSMSAKEEIYQVDDPVETLNEVLPRLRAAGAQTVIVLSHMGDAGTEALLADVDGVDICLVGHSRRPYRTERILNDAALICSSFEGRYIGRLDGQFDPASGDMKAFALEVYELNDSVADDPVMLERVEAFKVRHLPADPGFRGRVLPDRPRVPQVPPGRRGPAARQRPQRRLQHPGAQGPDRRAGMPGLPHDRLRLHRRLRRQAAGQPPARRAVRGLPRLRHAAQPRRQVEAGGAQRVRDLPRPGEQPGLRL